MKALYIAPKGSDGNDGTEKFPLATLEEARGRCRKIAGESPREEIRIIFKKGFYPIGKTVVFSDEDSRAAGRTVICGEETGGAALSGGRILSGWSLCEELPRECPEEGKGKIWETAIPGDITEFHVLFRGMKRMERTKSAPITPLKGDFDLTRSFGVRREEDRSLLKQVPFPAGEVGPSIWEKNSEVFFTAVPWQLSFLPVERIDKEAGIIHTTVEGTVPACMKISGDTWLENLIRDIKPGRWCAIRETGKIYYWPGDDELSPGDPAGKPVYIPVLKELIKIGGNQSPVENITLENMTFCHGDRYERQADHKGRGIQHDWDVFDKANALVRLRNAERCTVTGCRFTATGGSGLRLDLHCQKNLVEKNLIDYVGNMGILLCGYGPGTKDVNHHNEICDNLIHHCGDVIRHGHGIFLFQSGNNHIHHNRIHHVPRKGIGLNGVRVPMLEEPDITWDDSSLIIRWEEIEGDLKARGMPGVREHENSTEFWHNMVPYLHTRDNLVEYNEIFRALEDLGDGSAINVSGAGEGNRIRRNYIHHILRHEASGAMRVDDWQAGTIMAENLIYMINLAGFVHKNYNHIEDNIMVDCSAGEYIRFASYPDEEAHYGSRIKGNIFYETRSCSDFYKPAYMVSDGISKPENCDTDYNTFYCGEDMTQAHEHLAFWREKGIELNSRGENPFEGTPSHGSFLLKESDLWPAEKISRVLHGDWGLTGDYPPAYRELDYFEEEKESEYHRGRDPRKKAHDFW